jgi:hypothetical protein
MVACHRESEVRLAQHGVCGPAGSRDQSGDYDGCGDQLAHGGVPLAGRPVGLSM